MAAFAHFEPCWVDAQLPDLEAGKRFYGELFGWTFRPGDGPYAEALGGGKLVAALAAKQDGRMPTAWGVYFATDDIAATVARIREAGGQVIIEPLPAGGAGVLAQAADPGGAVFGLWQAGERKGFQKWNEPGSFCWTEVYTRQKDRVDAFYEEVFGFQGTDLGGPEEGAPEEDGPEQGAPGEREREEGARTEGTPEEGGPEQGGPEEGTPEEDRPDADQSGADESRADESRTTGSGTARSAADFRVWSPAGTEPGPDTAIGGRRVLTDAFPAEMPSYFLICFAVEDCNTTAGHTVRLGGRITTPPFEIPYGRMAVLQDDQGAVFAVLQPSAAGRGQSGL
ncbi:VOC family protein [Streptomyces sp. NPDC052052]|uniref:VOC family protein n=1 Tax=Streptomyces sp. NPDC052052 TaxID=3154756 RepID=UPI00341DD30B